MVQATEIKPRRNENPFEPHPDPSVTWVNTHVADCLSGVRISNAAHIPIDAKTAIKNQLFFSFFFSTYGFERNVIRTVNGGKPKNNSMQAPS